MQKIKKSRIVIIMFLILVVFGSSIIIKNKINKKEVKAPATNNAIIINPAADNFGLDAEIGRLADLYGKVPANSFAGMRLMSSMGETYVKYGMANEAIACFEKVLKENSKDKNSCYYLGMLYLTKGDTAKTVEYWRKYLSLDPNSYMKDSLNLFLRNHPHLKNTGR